MGDFRTAILYYKALLDNRPDDKALKLKLADVFLWSKDYDKALELYRQSDIKPETDRKRFKNLGDALLGAKRYDGALKAYDMLIRSYPDDTETKMNIADSLLGAGRTKEASEIFDRIMSEKKGDIKLMTRLAEILALRQRYDDAIKVCGDILAIDPDNSAAKLWLGRIYSWNRRYAEALSLYDGIIRRNPDWIAARREKARVLGWTREYGKSISEYRAILKDVKADEASRREMLAKTGFYNIFDEDAIGDYNRWLELEPENLEALYDLGQVYSRQMQWSNARKTYGRILEIIPSHFRAVQAAGKVDIYSGRLLGRAGAEYYEADSASRHMDERYYDFFIDAKAPIAEWLYASYRQDSFIHMTADPAWVNRQRFTAGAELYKKPWFWAIAHYAYSIYSHDLKVSHNFDEEINLRPLDVILLTASHRREDVLDNGQTMKSNLKRDDYMGRAAIRPNRRLTFGGDYKYSDYNDGNSRQWYGIDASCIVLHEPRFLKCFYRYEEYAFQKPNYTYFSPGSFHTNSFGVEFRHFLNKEELFWGTNDTYYTARYKVNFDVHDLTAHTIYADFHKDWNDRFSMHIEWHIIMYDRQETYREQGLNGYVSYYY